MSASRPLGRSGVFRLRIAVSKRHFMKSTPDAITSAKLLDTVIGQAWVSRRIPPEDEAGHGKRVSLEVTDEAPRSFQI